jgi:hypothetical protein
MLVRKKLSQLPKSRDKGSNSTLRALFMGYQATVQQRLHDRPMRCGASFIAPERGSSAAHRLACASGGAAARRLVRGGGSS